MRYLYLLAAVTIASWAVILGILLFFLSRI
jgi:hypothetical protein